MKTDFVSKGVWKAITSAAKRSRKPALVAVAYFAKGASKLLPLAPNSRLVVDASEGAVKSSQTCPADLKRLQKRGVVIYSYPFGAEQNIVDPKANAIVDRQYEFSPDIKRDGKDAIPRSAFQNELFAGISGLIWSRRSIGNFLGQPDDFMFVHNLAATRPIPRKWMNWIEEYQPVEGGKQLRRLKHRK
jgi:hypothetical protein